MFIASYMLRMSESKLEHNILVCISIEVETKRIQRFVRQSVRRAKSSVCVYRHSHNGISRRTRKQIHVTDVHARIFFSEFCIKMMGHFLCDLSCYCWVIDLRRYSSTAGRYVRHPTAVSGFSVEPDTKF